MAVEALGDCRKVAIFRVHDRLQETERGFDNFLIGGKTAACKFALRSRHAPHCRSAGPWPSCHIAAKSARAAACDADSSRGLPGIKVHEPARCHGGRHRADQPHMHQPR